MPDSVDNKKKTLGELVVSYFDMTSGYKRSNLKYLDQKLLREYFEKIQKKASKLVNKVISCIGIKPTEEQLYNTTATITSEILIPPDSNDKFDMVDDSGRVSEKLREIYITEKEPERAIPAYLYRRIQTLLKKFADEQGKEYIKLNQRVKKALATLVCQNEILETENGLYTISQGAKEASESDKIMHITLSDNLKCAGKKLPKTKQLIKSLLVRNPALAFASSYITAELANIFIEKISDIESIFDDEKSNNHEGILGTTDKHDALSVSIASEALDSLLLNQSKEKSHIQIQKEMAFLAYACRIFKGYFSSEILTNEQLLEKEEIKCVELFLNDRRFVSLKGSKPVRRTTAFNRLQDAKSDFKTVQTDLSAKEQGIFLRKYCVYLEKIILSSSPKT